VLVVTSKLSAAIRAEIHKRGISQGALAEKIGVSANSVTSWIKDRHLPDKESLGELRDFFGWNDKRISELLEDWFENDHGERNFRIAGADFVSMKYGGDYEEFLKEILALDKLAIPNVNFEHIGSAEQWAPIFQQTPYTWRLLVSGNEIVGYWQFLCLTDKAFRAALDGHLLDHRVDFDVIDFPLVSGRYKAYLPMITVKPQYRGVETVNLLLSSLGRTFQSMAASGVFLEDFCATAFTFEGRRLCQLIGMEFITGHQYPPHEGFAEIYNMQGSRVSDSYFGRRMPGLRKSYSDEF